MAQLFSEKVVQNIRKIMNDKNLTQYAIAEYMGTSESQFSKILKGTVKLSLNQLENLARGLSMREIDIITYPVKMVNAQLSETEREPVEAVLQIKLKKDKRDQVMRLVFGDNVVEILNK